MIQSATRMKIFRRFMRTNAPAALRQVWTDVRSRLDLLAVGCPALRQRGAAPGETDSFALSWRDVDAGLPKAASAALDRFFDGFADICSGVCQSPPCSSPLPSAIPFRVSRHEAAAEECLCCRRLFEEDADGAVSDILIVPRLAFGSALADHVLVFCSRRLLGPDETRFLHTCAGLYFAQQTIWESGQREEPAAALRPREIECVRWAITGKTLVEIAGIMGLSYRTVRFHLDSARSRYGFSTNQQLFVQAAKDYGLEPEDIRRAPHREESPAAARPAGRIQPMWAERRDPHDRRIEDRRQIAAPHLPFPDRRSQADRRTGQERRAVAESPPQSAEQVLTPEEIRALLH